MTKKFFDPFFSKLFTFLIMATSMNVISLITTKEISNKSYINGSSMYRSNKKNYNHFDFKLFNNLNNKDIHSFEEGDIVVLTGNFVFAMIMMEIILCLYISNFYFFLFIQNTFINDFIFIF